ncbi:hypothetical protein LIER_34596 [Lithospermum erythrorhizon]|uniref:Uncharacterized protein n=1 Tax=Lithospermum erythrorhizon TaxID=34254 RepID=A0AAV3S039_LITER
MIQWIETLNMRSGVLPGGQVLLLCLFQNAKWGTTRRPGPVVVSLSDVPATITKDVETYMLVETILSSKDEARTEIVDSDVSSDCKVTEVADSGDEAHEIIDSTVPLDCMIMEAAITGFTGNEAQTEAVDVQEPSDCVITKAVAVAVPGASLFTGERHHGSFEALTKFRRQDLSSQGEELKTASVKSSSKLQHETEAIDSVRTTLQHFEEKAAGLRQELADLDTHVEDLRR